MSYEETIALEQVPYNDLSPCIVDDEEIVARVLFSPKHYLDGEILPMAFEQIFSSDGMSILRKSHFFEESLLKTISQIETTESKYSGYVCAKVEADLPTHYTRKPRIQGHLQKKYDYFVTTPWMVV